MSLKDPQNYSIFTYLWVIGLSVWAGIVSYFRKLRAGLRFSLMEFIGEVVTSGFVGLLTYWLCEYAGIEQPLNAVLVGISAHMGSRAIWALENMLMRRYGP